MLRMGQGAAHSARRAALRGRPLPAASRSRWSLLSAATPRMRTRFARGGGLVSEPHAVKWSRCRRDEMRNTRSPNTWNARSSEMWSARSSHGVGRRAVRKPMVIARSASSSGGWGREGVRSEARVPLRGIDFATTGPRGARSAPPNPERVRPYKLVLSTLACLSDIPGTAAISSSVAARMPLTEPNLRSSSRLRFGPMP